MKILKLLLGLLFLTTIACKEEKPKVNLNKASKKVQHYICDNKCENSGGEMAGNCPTCSKPYTHNVAYHANDLLKSGPIKVESNATQPAGPVVPKTTNTPSPARNALGVYHYTCPNGCNGGAGKADNCKACGETLAHNTAYHNN